MLRKSYSAARDRSASKKAVNNFPDQIKKSPDSGLRPRIISSVRIEQRLLNQQITYKKRLESLKKSLEQEQLKEIREKPQISNKSRILAQKAERKLFQQPNLPSPTTLQESFSENNEKPTAQVQPECTSRSIPRTKTQKYLFLCDPHPTRSSKKKRTKSLFHLSVLERSEEWLKEKQLKIELKKKEVEEKALVECTFSPSMESKLKHSRSLRDGPVSSCSYIESPNSLELSELREGNSRVLGKDSVCRRIAPYQVKISFKCGIDLESFLKRAK